MGALGSMVLTAFNARITSTQVQRQQLNDQYAACAPFFERINSVDFVTRLYDSAC